MNTNLSGYQLLEKVSATAQTIVYRGIRKVDQTNVIIKFIGTQYPTLEDITKLKHEYTISSSLHCQGIIKPIGLENHHNGLALILPDFGGISLKQFLAERPLEVQQCLVLGIQLADILAYLHNNQIIHKDINPKNLIIHPHNFEIKITDFSIAEQLSRNTQAEIRPNLLEGTLPYISPEQTGRMNRSVDYRSDFYSLGITLYEMLTGQLPFSTIDTLELIYSHLAKTPLSPTTLIPEIPEAFSDIVMKLLAKRAEDRYQTAEGLKYDLEFCLNQLKSTHKIQQFILGQQDQSTQLMIPQKLYGREVEIATLMDAFTRVASPQEKKVCTSSSELILVSGYSGIGKTSLIQEIHKPLVRQRGRFISGKFDQFQRNIPYIALIQAFRELMHQLLTENAEQISAWKNKLLNALENNGQVIIDMIPEVEFIIGSQPPVPQLGATESQNRFNRVFQKFIQVFCSKLHPLVLFLDDLQWADSASLKFIQTLLNHPESQYLLLIGAYRDNEVYPTHPLNQTLSEIQQSGVSVHSICLQPLTFNSVTQLLSDTLKKSDRLQELAELIFNKTQGNPFFLTQLLKTLYKDQLLYFDLKTNQWLWDIHQIQSVDIIDYNIVELIARNIQELSDQTINVLKLAACIGHKFSLDTLAIINQNSPSNTAKQLWEALQAGLVIPLNNTYKIPLLESVEYDGTEIAYKFLHDRVQQAAYSLIPENRKKTTHLMIGQLLLQKSDLSIQENSIFDIVNQINIGREFLKQQQEREQLLKLNLTAAKKAKAATAYQASAEYLNVALELLSDSSWQDQYNLAFDLYREATEIAYLTTDFERSENLSLISLSNAKNLLDQVQIYELQIQCDIAQQQILRSIEIGMKVLAILGVSLHQDHGVCDLPSLEDLEEMPEMTDPYHLATLRLLKVIWTAAYNGKPELSPSIILTEVNFCLQYGHSAMAAPIYAVYGLLLCAGIENIEQGYQAGQIALKLLEQYQALEFKCEVYVLFYGFISPWKTHLKDSIKPLQQALQSGLEHGNLDFVGYCAIHDCYSQFFLGRSLDSLEKQQSDYMDLLTKLKQEYPLQSIHVLRQLTFNLSGHSQQTTQLIGSAFNEDKMLPILRTENNQSLLFCIYLVKMFLLYLYQEYEQAVEMANVVAQYTTAVAGWHTIAIHNFYSSLSLLALCHQNQSKDQLQQCIAQVNDNQETMKKWANHAPENYQHKFDLVEAEKARLTGNLLEAMEYYDRAIDAAKDQGYIQEAAIAMERAAEFYIALNRSRTARTYLCESYYEYIHWGAIAKAEGLKTQYSQFFNEIMSCEIRKTDTEDLAISVSTTTGKIGELLDLSTVNQAALVFSEEIILDQLLAKILKIAMENTGAVLGHLILENDDHQLAIESTGVLEREEILVKNNSSSVLLHSNLVPVSLINYVCRTMATIVLNDAAHEGVFTNDSYILNQKSKSILCMPILNQGELIGLIYLENNLATSVFTQKRLEILNFLSAQIGISLKKALLYSDLEKTTQDLRVAKQQLEEYSHNLEVKVQERTLALQDKNHSLEEKTLQLEKTMQQLQATQAQLIQTEKMSSLGQMVAGIAHEINNPISFIFGNLVHVREYFDEVFHALHLYQEELTHPPAELQAEIEEIDLEYIENDIPQMIQSMQSGATRIRDIVSNLRNFSCLDEAELKSIDIHQTIESTLQVLQHQMNIPGYLSVDVVKQYATLPEIECYPKDLNQVFLHIFSNAIDALKEFKTQNIDSSDSPMIQIKTELLKEKKVRIVIADNGTGMTETVQERIFDPFFTTKPVGSGTGLGLSVSYSTIVNQHKGDLRCVSAPGKGTEFIIEIPLKQS